MGVKKTNFYQLKFGSTLNANPYNPNYAYTGFTTSGSMSGTSTIYSNVQFVGNTDNIGLEVTWSGTPTGTISILGSNSGTAFYALTASSFNPTLGQPSGSAGGYLVAIIQFPFQYFALQYTNSSGSGSLTVALESKDLN